MFTSVAAAGSLTAALADPVAGDGLAADPATAADIASAGASSTAIVTAASAALNPNQPIAPPTDPASHFGATH